jgi:hypothetical protein
MTAGEIVEGLRRIGVAIRLDGGLLKIQPTPNAKAIALIRERKADIIALLTTSTVQPPTKCGERNFHRWGGGEENGQRVSVCYDCKAVKRPDPIIGEFPESVAIRERRYPLLEQAVCAFAIGSADEPCRRCGSPVADHRKTGSSLKTALGGAL